MAFDTFETGDGSPVELITFQNGLFKAEISNTVRSVTVGARTFQPLAYDLSPFAQSKDSDDNNRTMRVPNTFSVVDLFNGVLTSRSTLVTVERFHDDDPGQELQILWKGRIVAVNHVDNQQVDLLFQPSTSGAESTPPDTFSSICNAFLFESPGCNLAETAFRHVGTVTSILNGGFDLIVTGLRAQAVALDAALAAPLGPLSSAELDIYWQAGHIRTGDGEVRDIVEGNVLTDPDRIRLTLPLRDFQVLDGLSVFAGCDLLRLTCHKKFNNGINHQGYPDIPERDPANTELPPGTRTSTTKFAGPQ